MSDPSQVPEFRSRLAGDLLRIGAVSLSPDTPYTWSSGLRSPIYCDNRLTLSYPDIRSRIADGFVAMIKDLGLHPDVIIGTATAGIPHAAWVAERMQLPMAYVRSKPKGHGRRNQIEGRLEQGWQSVVIEDLISTGGSSSQAAQAVQAEGVSVDRVLAIFSYGLPIAEERFLAAGVDFSTLTDYATLLGVALQEGILPDESVETLRNWQKDPEGWFTEL